MTTVKLSEITRRHCEATKPAYNLKGFVQIAYGITSQQLSNIASGRRNASAKFLNRLELEHTRLFPSEPVTLLLPNQPPVLLGHQSAQN